MLVFKSMTLEIAEEIHKWEYEEPYSLYNLEYDEHSLKEFVKGDYFSVWGNEDLIGYVCYGEPATVPSGKEVGVYQGLAIDMGLGMHPGLTGKGNGLALVKRAMEHGEKTYDSKSFRLTVAAFNKRAKKVYERAGFSYESSFTNHEAKCPILFEVMVKTM